MASMKVEMMVVPTVMMSVVNWGVHLVVKMAGNWVKKKVVS